jgi:hypothetical protein
MSESNRSQQGYGGWVVPQTLTIGLVATPLLGALFVLGAILWVGVPRIYQSLTPQQFGLIPAAYDELTAATNEHAAIVRLAAACVVEKELDSALIASHPFARLNLDRSLPVDLSVQGRLTPRLPGYLDADLYLSYAISNARLHLADQVVMGHFVAQLFQWTIVVTGMFTTILISVKGFANPQTKGYLPMAIAAIVLSALGTSVAGLNSFYTPRLEYEQSQRSLASLRALHTTLAGSVVRQRGACEKRDNWSSWRAREIRELTNSYMTIMNTISRPPTGEDDPENEPPSGTDQKGNGGGRGSQGTPPPTQPTTFTNSRRVAIGR